MPIQKLMSVPVLDKKREVRGVIQISRKGFDLASAGPDLSSEDLKLLEQAAAVVAAVKFMQKPCTRTFLSAHLHRPQTPPSLVWIFASRSAVKERGQEYPRHTC